MADLLFYEDLEVGASTRFGNYEVTREEVLDIRAASTIRSRSTSMTRRPQRPTSARSPPVGGTPAR